MNVLTIVGNLTETPTLNQTKGGTAVANFRIAHTPRVFDKDTKEFVDGEPLFLNGAVWHRQAENFAASAKKGDRVTVTGRLKANNWEKDGEKRTSVEIDAEEIGLSTRFKSVSVGDAAPSGGGSSKSESTEKPKEKAPAAAAKNTSDDDEF
jgi:single-strand DNA-binding protein